MTDETENHEADSDDELHQNFLAKKNEIDKMHLSIKSFHDSIFDENGIKQSVDDYQHKITEAHSLIFNEGGIEADIKCLIDDNNALLESLKEDKGNVEIDFQNLYETLNQEIKSLLPDAGAAGLASGYLKSKKYVGNSLKSIFNHVLFILPLIAIFFFAIYDFENKEYLNLLSLNELKIETILLKMIVFSPLALISYFGFSSIRLNRRMYEEYNHKQRVMQLYRSFDEEIQGEEFEDERQELIKTMLETVSNTPSRIMGKYDKPSFLEVMQNLVSLKKDNVE